MGTASPSRDHRDHRRNGETARRRPGYGRGRGRAVPRRAPRAGAVTLDVSPSEAILLRTHMRSWLADRSRLPVQADRVITAQDARQLADVAYELTGIRVADRAVCGGHTAPLQALADAFFARAPMVVWHASRGFGGKTTLMALLGHLETVILGADVTIL